VIGPPRAKFGAGGQQIVDQFRHPRIAGKTPIAGPKLRENAAGVLVPIQNQLAMRGRGKGQPDNIFETAGSFNHLFVSAASNLAYQSIHEFDLEAARKTIDAKLVAALLLSKYAARQINEHRSITFTAGIAAERPMPTAALVAAVNGGLFSFTYALAIELAPVCVNAISHGWIETPLWDTTFGANKQTMFERTAHSLPVGRIGRPADIGHAAIFLMENEFTTATVLPVDGGHRLV